MKKLLRSLICILLILTIIPINTINAADSEYTFSEGYDTEYILTDENGDSFTAYCLNRAIAQPVSADPSKDTAASVYESATLGDLSEEVQQKLLLATYAGYPQNGMGYFTIDNSEFTIDDFKDLLSIDETLHTLLPQYEVGMLVRDLNTAHDVIYAVIATHETVTSEHYVAILDLYNYTKTGTDPMDETSLTKISNAYWAKASGREPAIKATQNAIWAILIEAGAPGNIKYNLGETDADASTIVTSLLSTPLAKQIYDYANSGITFPDVTTPKVSNSNLEFTKQTNGQYLTSEITVTGDGTLSITLPEGIDIYYDGQVQDHIESGKAFRLISDSKPADTGTITIKATGQVVPSDVYFFTEVQPASKLKTLTITHQNLMAINRKVSVAKTSFNYKVSETKKTVETGAYDYSMFWIILTVIPLAIGGALVLKKKYN